MEYNPNIKYACEFNDNLELTYSDSSGIDLLEQECHFNILRSPDSCNLDFEVLVCCSHQPMITKLLCSEFFICDSMLLSKYIRCPNKILQIIGRLPLKAITLRKKRPVFTLAEKKRRSEQMRKNALKMHSKDQNE